MVTCDERTIEAIVNGLVDVVSSRAVLNAEGNLEELHVLAQPGRSPKQIVRDIETAVMVKLGMELDHKKVSVAQLELESKQLATPRPKVGSVQFAIEGMNCKAQVELTLGEEQAVGLSTGPASRGNQLRLLAQATVHALAQLLPEHTGLVVEDVTTTPITQGKAVIVAVTRVTPRYEETLVGAALIKHDEKAAVVRATLDAVNRRIATM